MKKSSEEKSKHSEQKNCSTLTSTSREQAVALHKTGVALQELAKELQKPRSMANTTQTLTTQRKIIWEIFILSSYEEPNNYSMIRSTPYVVVRPRCVKPLSNLKHRRRSDAKKYRKSQNAYA